MTKDLSQTKMEASGEGNFSVSMNTSSSAPFQEERLGLGFYPRGVVHVKVQTGMLVQFFFVETWANPIFFFWGGGGWLSDTCAIFFLDVTTGAIFHPRLQCNFQKLLRCHREENLQHGYTRYTVQWQNLLTDKLSQY